MSQIRTLEYLVSVVDYILGNKKRRHIVGGALLSMSAMFAGLAITTMTLKPEEENKHD